MYINTSRFGQISIVAEDVIIFPKGVVGFEDCRHWIVLASEEGNSVGWLQSVSQPTVALPVISPRRIDPGYEIKLAQEDLDDLSLSSPSLAYTLVVLSRHEETQLSANLRAPVLINLDDRLGKQVITLNRQPLQRIVLPLSEEWKRAA
ncbi:MAG: flagellar assembly protein FliW [Pirellulaceae bacterium]|nr:flagellar assembly protein FliW [Pirellulaceae bacterium]